MITPEPPRMDRRLAIKWMVTASAGAMLLNLSALRGMQEPFTEPGNAGSKGYGTDPDLVKAYRPGDVWPLTFSSAQRRQAAALCDIIVPAEGETPSASSVGVVDFIDEWISAPYPYNIADAKGVIDGLAWLDAESGKRFGTPFADTSASQRLSLCEEISANAPAGSPLEPASRFFRLFRDLTVNGFFTTPVGMKDLGYVGNVPLARFDGPPAGLVDKLGLADEVKW